MVPVSKQVLLVERYGLMTAVGVLVEHYGLTRAVDVAFPKASVHQCSQQLGSVSASPFRR